MNANRICLLLLATTLVCMPREARAQTPSQPTPDTLQVATELTSLMVGAMTAEMTSRAISQAWPQMESALRAQNASIDSGTLGELRGEFEQLMLGGLGDLAKDAPAVYARNFTAAEMRDLIAFYRTPTGAKALRVMPQVSSELLSTMTPHIQGLQEKVTLSFLNTLQRKGLYAR